MNTNVAEQPPESNTVSMFERLARDASVDVGKLQGLMDLQERAAQRDAKAQATVAMAKAQAEMRPISADAENPQTRSKYASYAALDRALRPIYTSYGFALSFNAPAGAADGFVRVSCELSHIGGHSREYSIDMPSDGKGAKGNDVMTKTHATGAAASYGMRYLLKMIFNVAVGEDDRDGNTSEVIGPEQVETLEKLLLESQSDRAKYLRYMKVNDLAEIPLAAYGKAEKVLRDKMKAKP